MALTLKKLLQLHHLQEFKCIAGGKGLDRIVTSTGILDYEPLLEKSYDSPNDFGPNAFVLSSLLFAYNDPSLILPAIIELNEKEKVAAFAFKDAIIGELPQEVLEYADENNFPIFQFSDSWFENIIFTIMDAVQVENDELLTEKILTDMIQMNLQRSQILSIISNLSLHFQQFLCSFYIQIGKIEDNSTVEDILKNASLDKELQQKCLIANYKNGYFLFITGMGNNPDEYYHILNKLIPYSEKNLPQGWIIGKSEILDAETSLDLCTRQAYFAYYGAQILNKSFCTYTELGTLKFLIPLMNVHEVEEYRKKTLDLLNQEKDLLETAQVFIREKGNIKNTAKSCYCHPNTIRYRLKRIKQLLELEEEGDHEVYEQLSTCFKLDKLNDLINNQ